MKIALIYPSFGAKLRATQLEPLTMAALAGLTPPDVEIAFWDDRIEDIPYDDPVDLAALSVQTFTAKRAYEIAREFRKRNILVVLGGFHASFMPEEAHAHADAVVIGEAEELWPVVLKDLRQGCLKRTYGPSSRSDLKGLIYRREIFRGKRYLPVRLVEFGRGCPSACNFCSVSSFFHQRKQCRPVEEVVEEIRQLPQRAIMFVDDNMIADKETAKRLFQALKPLKKRWMAQTGIDIATDNDLLDLAAASGCYGLMIGFESLNDLNLRQMGKSAAYNQTNFEHAIRRIHDRGIKICASFLFGYDEDDRSVFSSTLAFAVKKRFVLGLFCHLMPFPGTAFYEQLRDQNRLLNEKWWLATGYRWGDVVFRPKRLTDRELSDGCKWSRLQFYALSNILRRMVIKANARSPVVSMLVNLLIRKDVLEKQGFLLGRNMPARSD
jgi:radical SAM superfamily enzyme YgiQ (UPF0313 family)